MRSKYPSAIKFMNTVKTVLNEKGMQLNELARSSGLKESEVYSISSGYMKLDIDKAEKILSVIGYEIKFVRNQNGR